MKANRSNFKPSKSSSQTGLQTPQAQQEQQQISPQQEHLPPQQSDKFEQAGGSLYTPSIEEVELEAYHIYARNGYEDGRHLDHWLEAERELSNRKGASDKALTA